MDRGRNASAPRRGSTSTGFDARGGLAADPSAPHGDGCRPGRRADAFANGSRAYAAHKYVLSAEIFLPLAEQGDARAQTYLGVMYLRGQGVPQNFRVAAYWLHLASEAGLPAAQYFLGLMYDKGQGVAQDFVLAHAWLNLAVAHAGPSLRSRWVLIRDAVASKMS